MKTLFKYKRNDFSIEKFEMEILHLGGLGPPKRSGRFRMGALRAPLQYIIGVECL